MSPPDGRNPLDRLAEEFVEAHRRGQGVSIEVFAERHPEHAPEIRRLFPALLLLEHLRSPAREDAESRTRAGKPEATHPEVVGGYRVGRELGRGGMATVFEGWRAEGARPGTPPRVALKFLHPRLTSGQAYEERLLREAAIGRAIDHPNVVRTLDVGVHQDGEAERPYVVLEYVEGRRLADLAASLGGSIPEGLLRHLALQIARGLRAIHGAGAVHRDLKPSNVMVTPENEVRIMDLGVARLVADDDEISASGQFVGSVRYAAPEQSRYAPDAIGPSADLYALGATLFELASGRHPFSGAKSPQAMLLAHAEEPAPRLRAVAPDVSPFLDELLATLLAKRPEDRLPDAATLERVLADGEAGAWWHERARRASTRAAGPRVARETPMVGREEALARLREALCDARAGAGSIVLLEGEAGVGKSRLLDALLDDLETDTNVLYGAFHPGEPNGALRAALLAHLRGGDPASLLGLLPGDGALRRAFLADLRGGGFAPDAPLSTRTRAMLFGALVRGLAAEHPLLWIVEDADAAPAAELEIVAAMGRAVSGLRAVLLLTGREIPTALRERLAGVPRLSRLALPRLGPGASLDLLRRALGTAPWVGRLARRVAAAADGNPFFLLEIVKDLRERSRREPGGSSTLGSDDVDRFPVPAAVRELLQARVSALSEADRSLLECAAVEGLAFDATRVARALGRDLLDVLQRLGVLERRGGLVRSVGERYRFDHQQVQDVLQEDLAPALRRAYHARLARVLSEVVEAGRGAGGEDAVRLLRHALEGGDHALARPVLGAALDRLRGTDPGLGLRLAALALECPLAGAERLEVLRARVLMLDIVDASDRYEEAVNAYVAAAEAAGDAAAQSDALRARAFKDAKRGDLRAARGDAERAAALARDAGDGRLMRLGLHAVAFVANQEGRFADAARATEDALASARADRDAEAEGTVLIALATGACDRGDYAAALARLAEAERAVGRLESGSLRHDIRIAGTRGNALYAMGRFGEAEAAYAEALLRAERLGDRELAGITLDNRAGVLLALGRLGEALEGYAAAEALFDELGGLPARRQNARANRGALLGMIGDPGAARPLLHEALAFFERAGIRRLALSVQTSLTRLLAAEGEVHRARREAEAILAARRGLGWSGVAEAALLACELAAAAGDVAVATSHARAAEEAAAMTRAEGDRRRARAWRALLGDADPDREEPPPMARFDEVEFRLLRSRVTGGEEDRTRARVLLADLEASLPPARQAAFRAEAPASRAASAWGA